MEKPIAGSCLCGAVHYSADAEPLFMTNCFCRDCQKAHGGEKSSEVFVPRKSLSITGDIRYHEVTGDSGKGVRRGFCPTCGSPLVGMPAIAPDIASVTAGSLDDPSWFRPSMNVYTCRALPWAYLDPDIPGYEQLPDAVPGL